jgi:hypothetical protein
MRHVLSMFVFGSLVAMTAGSGCVGMEELSGESTGELGKKDGPKLNLSHIECQADGTVNAHFVLLFWGASQPPPLSGTYNGGSFGPVEATKTTGNVWHYNVTLPSGDIDIYTATIGSISLHNPGEYAGDYQCGEEPVCSVVVEPIALLCTDAPLGNPGAECGYFGLDVQGKIDNLTGNSYTALNDAYVAIVKSGSGGCEPGQSAYQVYVNVQANDVLYSPTWQDISHVTYCACPDGN